MTVDILHRHDQEEVAKAGKPEANGSNVSAIRLSKLSTDVLKVPFATTPFPEATFEPILLPAVDEPAKTENSSINGHAIVEQAQQPEVNGVEHPLPFVRTPKTPEPKLFYKGMYGTPKKPGDNPGHKRIMEELNAAAPTPIRKAFRMRV